MRDRKIQALKDAGADDETAEAGGYVWAKYALRRAYALGENELGILRPDALTPAELDRLEIEGERAAAQAETPQKKSPKHRNFELGAEVEGALRELGHLAKGDTYGQAAGDKLLYERRLDRDEKKWFQFVDDLAQTDSGIQIRMMGTPLVFTLVTTRDGNSVSRYPLFVGTGKLQKIQRDHPYMTGDVLKQIPRALADPIAIFRSSEKSKNPNGLVAMLELRVPVNEQGQEDTVIAALRLNTKKTHTDIDINVLTSAYSKANERVNPAEPNPGWFASQEKLSNLVYVNTKKSSAWSQTTGVQFPSVATVRNLASNSIKTEADLVKLRKENGNRFYQSAAGTGASIVREGVTRKPDSAPAKVVYLAENVVPKFERMKDFRNWLKSLLMADGNPPVTIQSTGARAVFTGSNVEASLKRSRSEEHREAYAALREMISLAEYDHFEPTDARHPYVQGQDVYHAALTLGDKLYSVRLKLDVLPEIEQSKGDVVYKDHRLSEIEIAPALYRRVLDESQGSAQPAGTISTVSLGVLRGNVKPSSYDGVHLSQERRGQIQFGPGGASVITLFKDGFVIHLDEAYASDLCLTIQPYVTAMYNAAAELLTQVAVAQSAGDVAAVV